MYLSMQNVLFKALSSLLCCFCLVSCTQTYDGRWNPPLLYKLNIQQGNALEQHMLGVLRPGMTRQQVRFVMGTPVLVDPFRQDRWDYVYTFQKRGGIASRRHIILYFDGDALVRVAGDVQGSAEQFEGDAAPLPAAIGDTVSTDEDVDPASLASVPPSISGMEVLPMQQSPDDGFLGKLPSPSSEKKAGQ